MLPGIDLCLDPTRLRVIAAGKAAAAMVRPIYELARGVRGVVVAPARPRSLPPGARGLRWIAAEHPLPGRGSFRAGRAVLDEVQAAAPDDTILVLLSGGASSLLECPAPGLTTAEVRAAYRVLLTAGLSIVDMNRIRSCLSALKGGGLRLAAGRRRVITLALSDVPGDDPAAIGSGPTVLPPRVTTGRATGSRRLDAALHLLRAGGLDRKLSPRVRAMLEREEGAARGTRSAGLTRAAFRAPSVYVVVGSNADARRAAAAEARRLGYAVRHRAALITGEATRAGTSFGRGLGPVPAGRPVCVVAGGESTVQIAGPAGQGGRNQEFVIAASRAVRAPGWVLLAAGTDGRDGPTPAAGALLDATVLGRVGRGLLDAALRHHDVYPLLARLGALIETGPTGTNVMDLALALSFERRVLAAPLSAR